VAAVVVRDHLSLTCNKLIFRYNQHLVSKCTVPMHERCQVRCWGTVGCHGLAQHTWRRISSA
jgi:hypothetical protein